MAILFSSVLWMICFATNYLYSDLVFPFHLNTWCRPPGERGSLCSGLDASNGNVGRKSTVNDDIDGDGDDNGDGDDDG